MSFLLDGSQRSIRRRLENKISKEVMSGNLISTSGTGERVISHLVTLLATSRRVTLTTIDKRHTHIFYIFFFLFHYKKIACGELQGKEWRL